MIRFKFMRLIGVVVLMGASLLSAPVSVLASPSSIIRLNRDSTYEQNLKYLASVDTAITPARVIRWLNSMVGNTSMGAPSNFEFQPVLNVHDSRKQFTAQVVYKF